jgi:hypothetical protein
MAPSTWRVVHGLISRSLEAVASLSTTSTQEAYQMHAIRLYAFGPPENLTYEEIPDPQPAEGQVRIRA